jgi:hypothetical protein
MASTEYGSDRRSGRGEGYRLCPQCGNYSHVSEGQSYCGVCGTKLIEECPRCHAAVHYPTARFCSDCGLLMVCSGESSEARHVKQRNVAP